MALDFLRIVVTSDRKGQKDIWPRFKVSKSKDLMIRGRDFYAVWCESKGLWSTDEDDVIAMVDSELQKFIDEYPMEPGVIVRPHYMSDSSSGAIDDWHKYVQRQCRDNYHMLDEKIVFANDPVTKEDYASHILPYSLMEGPTNSWDELMGVLYSPSELDKIEWAIGSIVTGDSKDIQKFMVLYGSHGTGKSTLINIIQLLFSGYYTVFDAKSLTSQNASFALEPFNCNPLVGIQHDGDLSRIEDNTRLNSIVSHEEITINEKFKAQYTNRIKAFLFMGTNRPVKITDAKSGIIRRLIDVTPTGNKVPLSDWKRLNKGISYELGAIAYKCRESYLSDPDRYDSYVPTSMISESNDFFNFIIDSYLELSQEPGISLKHAWDIYKKYAEEANITYSMTKRVFKFELQNYYRNFSETAEVEGIGRVSGWYEDFIFEKIPGYKKPKTKQKEDNHAKKLDADKLDRETHEELYLEKQEMAETNDDGGGVNESFIFAPLKDQESPIDDLLATAPAQYANKDGLPPVRWERCSTCLYELSTRRLHYVIPEESHIVIDFDIRDASGEKSLSENIKAASVFPPTYAELSKSGKGLHLHYLYSGDVSQLSPIYDKDIEIKVFTGNSSLRRKLTLNNGLDVTTISSGLPLKGDGPSVINQIDIQNEQHLTNCIKKALRKEVHANTTPNIFYIKQVLDEAYASKMSYSISGALQEQIINFALNSSHQSGKCLAIVQQMHFKSEDDPNAIASDENAPIIFFDAEVMPGRFGYCYKFQGQDKVFKVPSPTVQDVESLFKYRLIGFNNRRYDNHILYAKTLGYTNDQLYSLSKKIVGTPKGEQNKYLFGNAYNLSYTDIYDYCSAGNKMGLKKWEIKLGIHHQECPYRWDQEVTDEQWLEVMDYCANDVIATEAVFNATQADYTARLILADIAGLTPNDTTNQLTTRIIFGTDKSPQKMFNYRDMSKPVEYLDPETEMFLRNNFPEMMSHEWPENSKLPYWPDYKHEFGKSLWKDELVGEGGYVYAKTGIYYAVALLDVASMHPHSLEAECYFGPKRTRRFRDIVEGRIDIKHKDWDAVNDILDGKLAPYVEKVKAGEMSSKDLANALKTAINSVYGLTAASFPNAMKHPDNKDNIVAKRGALFMCVLKEEVQKRGFTVAHIKTDSIKIPNATPEIIQFVMDFGRLYGYSFEHEATYERMCLVNDAVYIARYATPEWCENAYGYVPGDCADHGGEWTATGAQFAEPYVFKSLFTHEDIEREDLCVTVASSSALYLDLNEGLQDTTRLEAERVKLIKKGEPIPETLQSEIEKNHNYVFVGKVGLFTPVVAGTGGGTLLRENDKGVKGKEPFAAAGGTTGYRFIETEVLERTIGWDNVDISYFDKLADNAIEQINKYGRFENFVSVSA